MIKYLLVLLVCFNCFGAQEGFRISNYPNKPILAPSDLFITANPGVTNNNISYQQLLTQFGTNINYNTFLTNSGIFSGTIADMQKLGSPSTNTIFITGGRTTNTDGGGGILYYVKNASDATNLGTIFAVPYGSVTGRAFRPAGVSINARWFGANKNNANNTLQLQVALSAVPTNGILVIDDTYYTQALNVPSSVTITGGGTLKHINDATVFGTFWLLFFGPNTSGQTLDNITLDGNIQGQTIWTEHLTALKLADATDVSVRNCVFTNLTGDGAYVSHDDSVIVAPFIGSSKVSFIGDNFYGISSNRNAISFVCATNWLVSSCNFYAMARSTMPGAIDIETQILGEFIKDGTIISCNFYGHDLTKLDLQQGIALNNNSFNGQVTGIKLLGNTFNGNFRYGAGLFGSTNQTDDFLFSGNNFQNSIFSSGYGLISRDVNLSLNGDKFNYIDNIAIWIQSGNAVINNVCISKAGLYGMRLSSSNAIVNNINIIDSGNKSIDAGRGAIWLDGSNNILNGGYISSTDPLKTNTLNGIFETGGTNTIKNIVFSRIGDRNYNLTHGQIWGININDKNTASVDLLYNNELVLFPHTDPSLPIILDMGWTTSADIALKAEGGEFQMYKRDNSSYANLTVKNLTSISGTVSGSSGFFADIQITNTFIPPRIPKSRRDAIVPSEGMYISQTDNTPGVYIYNNGVWIRPQTGTTNLDEWSTITTNQMQVTGLGVTNRNGILSNNIVAGASISIVSGASGQLTISSVNTNSGTVSSVGLSVPAAFSVSGSPITTNGTLAISYSGTAIPVVNGGSGGVNASQARTNFGLLTGLGITNTGSLYSNNIVAGSNITITSGANGQLTVASTGGLIVPTGIGVMTVNGTSIDSAASFIENDFDNNTAAGGIIKNIKPNFNQAIYINQSGGYNNTDPGLYLGFSAGYPDDVVMDNQDTNGGYSFVTHNGGTIINRIDKTGDVAFKHIGGSVLNPQPTFTIGPGVGGSGSATIDTNGNDVSFIVTVVSGLLPPINSVVFSCTFGKAYSTIPHVLFSPSNPIAARITGASPFPTNITTTGFDFKSNDVTGITASQTFVWTFFILK